MYVKMEGKVMKGEGKVGTWLGLYIYGRERG